MIDVKMCGAIGDGVHYDTEAIQRAIDQGVEAGEGIYFPDGTYLTGTIYLKSNTELWLSSRAVVLGSTEPEHYAEDTHHNRYAGESVMDQCLFYAENSNNIRIVGGTFDGNGSFFYGEKEREVFHPMMFRFLRCQELRIEKTAIRMPAGWSTAFIECERIWITGMSIVSRHFNGDGLDFDSCQEVWVSDCHLDTSDDSLCIQNSVAGRVSRDIMIRNCIMTSKWAAVRIGLLNSGDIESVLISDCIFRNVLCSGFKIQAAEEGRIHNIIMKNIIMHNVTRPIFVTSNYCRLGLQEQGVHPVTEGIDGLYFKDIVIDDAAVKEPSDIEGILLVGISERRIRNVFLKDIVYHAAGGWRGEILPAEDLEEKRPEYFSVGQSPAAVMYAENVTGLLMDNCSFDVKREDNRELCVFANTSFNSFAAG